MSLVAAAAAFFLWPMLAGKAVRLLAFRWL
jgi:hypothetical protein